jgi:argininosuccinate lyase
MADYLAKKGLPFREAHGLVGQAVRLAEETGRPLTDLPVAELQALSSHFGEDIALALRMDTAVAQRDVPGGTAPAAVREQLAQARQYLAERD